MEFYEKIFVVLVYKNLDDIKAFIRQAEEKITDYKIIIVESFSDDECTEKLREIAENSGCDFLPLPNKGYSYGNNAGIDFATKNYEFDYLIVCNADIDILRFPDQMPESFKGKVIAPVINTVTGKAQNPFWAENNHLAEKFMYLGMKNNILLFSYFGFGIYKLQRLIFLKKFKNSTHEKNIAAAHGAFIIFSKEVLNIIGLPFDDNMFLFAEECLLAHKLKKYNVQIVMTKEINVLHHEDGSMHLANIKQLDERRKSIVYYYESVHGKNRK